MPRSSSSATIVTSDKCISCYHDYAPSRIDVARKNGLMTDTLPLSSIAPDPGFVDERHYLFDRHPDRPWPPNEATRLLATVRRSWRHDNLQLPRFAGQLRSRRLDVQVIIRQHKALKHSWRVDQPVEDQFCVLDEPVTYDPNADRVTFGSADIQTRNPYLRRQGLGTLMFNAMIAWTRQYHPDATVAALQVTDFSKDGPAPFYKVFGFTMTGQGTQPMAVSDLRFSAVSDRFQPIAPNMIV